MRRRKAKENEAKPEESNLSKKQREEIEQEFEELFDKLDSEE